MSALYFEDFNVGDVFTTPARTITEADVMMFAGLSGDYNPLHTDAAMARDSAFGERVAHGLLGVAVATGLVARLGIYDGTAIALLGLSEWNFKAPILFGDTIHVEMEISDKRRTSNPSRGILWRATRLRNDRGELLQEGTFVLLMRCRDGQGPTS